ncbi:MAG: hypothetical protein INR69_00055 [Mucilaginibacter polytrichastri]|nr:hypothetical protein [Mucilaginibacter polytrichastri]
MKNRNTMFSEPFTCASARRIFALVLLFSLAKTAQPAFAQKIDRKALVTRHNLHITQRDLRGPSQVGNGHFAFGFDITGLQTYNNDANTLSNWGWHRFPLPPGADPYAYEGREWDTQGRLAPYDVENEEEHDLYRWMIANPRRLNLGRLAFVLKKKNGDSVLLKDLEQPQQHVDLWSGISESTFSIEGKPVKVITVGDPRNDVVAVRVEAPELNDGRIALLLSFPYASTREFGNAGDWNSPDKHTTKITLKKDRADFSRTLDSTTYSAALSWKHGGTLSEQRAHTFLLTPGGRNELEVVLAFQQKGGIAKLPAFSEVKKASIEKWPRFWNSGGAIDLSGSRDKRWIELERRIVLSQYVMEINEAGDLPPQESGLVNNGWFGKYHFEMIWWHAAQYGLWGRLKQMDDITKIYRTDYAFYRNKAKKQGYEGLRWPKTLGDHERWEWPNEINPLLIWQQPHPIFFAELEYRSNPTQEVLNKWKDVIEGSADFMASFPYYHEREKRYILGYPLQVVSENARPRTTINPTFELSYWRTGLRLAQEWRKRLKLAPKPEYEKVLKDLSALPVQDGRYVSWENIYAMWTVYNFEHPALTGAYGMLPGDGVDPAIMDRTLDMVGKTWNFEYTWGWDFPMLAMCAARLGHGDKAIGYLLDYPSFTWDEHGFSGGGVAPYPYFPANGGLLYAVAMMTAGWDGSKGSAPGFPKDGSWVVKYEGLKPAL